MITSIPSSIVKYFAQKNNVSVDCAQQIFDELAEFLKNAASSVRRPSKRLDEAWHIFILHTKEYTDFCTSNFGRFIHHVPDSDRVRNKDRRTSICSSDCQKE